MTGKKYATNCLQVAASLKLSFNQTATSLRLQLPWLNSPKIQIIPFERMTRTYVNAFEKQANTNAYCCYGKHRVNKGTVKQTPGSWHCTISLAAHLEQDFRLLLICRIALCFNSVGNSISIISLPIDTDTWPFILPSSFSATIVLREWLFLIIA